MPQAQQIAYTGSNNRASRARKGRVVANERILVVDDGRENREFIIKYILQPNEYRVQEARDGVECLEIVRRDPPDLILLDLQMPRLDGMGVLEALQRERLDIPVILMTFHGSEDIAVEVFRMGVRDYLKKPYTAEEMLSAIERSLAEVRLRREKEALTMRLMNANRELHTRIKELNTLYSIGKSVTALLDLPQLLRRITEAAISLTNAEQARLILVENGALVLRAIRPRGEQNAQNAAETLQDRLAERAISTARYILLNAQQLEPLRQANPNAPFATLYVPLLIGNTVIGVLNAENLTANTRQFTDNDAALLSALGDYAAIAIENARNYHALETLKAQAMPNAIGRSAQLPEADSAARREISVLVADLRGFSALAEQQRPEQALRLLNAYLSLAAETLTKHGAQLDRASGDTVMALFNAPHNLPDHTLRAVQAALALQQETARFGAQHGTEMLAFAIGVARGEALVGTVGVGSAAAYAAVGEPVNLAYRLQESARAGQILIEENALVQLGNRIVSRRLGEVQLRSRRSSAVVYEVQELL
ncbi:MAG: response regulator [Chloroflexota bacterium]|nr:MAG: response regulator [Chloroflexota bacterium]